MLLARCMFKSGEYRGSIIEFIEKSDKHKIVHQYYLNLLIQKEFYESLNEVASFLKNEIESFTIVSYQQKTTTLKEQGNSNQIPLINHLQNYLKFLTNNVSVDNQESLLLIFDNAPDMEIVEKYLPQKGDVIITSRNYNIPSAIEVYCMEKNEALALLKKLLNITESEKECTELVQKLGYIPLAISQAGAYISFNKRRVQKSSATLYI